MDNWFTSIPLAKHLAEQRPAAWPVTGRALRWPLRRGHAVNPKDRIRLERTSQEQSKDTYKTLRDCQGRKRVKESEVINDGASTPAPGRLRLRKRMMYSLLYQRWDCIDIDYVDGSNFFAVFRAAGAHENCDVTRRQPCIKCNSYELIDSTAPRVTPNVPYYRIIMGLYHNTALLEATCHQRMLMTGHQCTWWDAILGSDVQFVVTNRESFFPSGYLFHRNVTCLLSLQITNTLNFNGHIMKSNKARAPKSVQRNTTAQDSIKLIDSHAAKVICIEWGGRVGRNFV
ncbi:hypothetical protein EVAR_14914_1 [Eumeta japonica]|uniref:Uncharacterized protein n=1 Tax=Eumeta variegata TaxID=151549 RepID=A0A4C1XK88_EUMVA|nr:hypothetical protein EVAR_14914_1 [Eumeta japonica]